MKIPRHIRDESGFTMQEVLVVLIVGSILIAFCFELFLFVNRLFFNWEITSEFRTEAGAMYQRINLDLQHAKSVVARDDTSLVLIRHDGKRIEYWYSNGQINRNDVQLLGSGGTLTIQPHRAEGSDSRHAFTFKIDLLATKRKQTLELSGLATIDLTARERFLIGLATKDKK